MQFLFTAFAISEFCIPLYLLCPFPPAPQYANASWVAARVLGRVQPLSILFFWSSNLPAHCSSKFECAIPRLLSVHLGIFSVRTVTIFIHSLSFTTNFQELTAPFVDYFYLPGLKPPSVLACFVTSTVTRPKGSTLCRQSWKHLWCPTISINSLPFLFTVLFSELSRMPDLDLYLSCQKLSFKC